MKKSVSYLYSVYLSIFVFVGIPFQGCFGMSDNQKNGEWLSGKNRKMEWLEESRADVVSEENAKQERLKLVISRATELLQSDERFSVTFNESTAPSSNRRDYTSTAPYWWPNPATDSGLPWVRRDGKVNRSVRGSDTDSAELGEFVNALGTLSLAYFYTQEHQYADQAQRIIHTFLLDQKTGMNPHLRYAQSIPGVVDGRGIGIIETRLLINVIDAHEILLSSEKYRREISLDLKNWFSRYLDWLLTSPNGIDESRTRNNHASFYDYQIAYFSRFVGEDKILKRVLSEVYSRRIKPQISQTGKQPHELERTRPYHYSVFNLEALWGIAAIASDLQRPSLVFEEGDDVHPPRIVAALDYVNARHHELLRDSQYAPEPVSRESLIRVNLIAGEIYAEYYSSKARELIRQFGDYGCLLRFPMEAGSQTGIPDSEHAEGLCQL